MFTYIYTYIYIYIYSLHLVVCTVRFVNREVVGEELATGHREEARVRPLDTVL